VSDPWDADPAAIPALAAVLRSGMLRKVRTFEMYCESGEHRRVQVLTIDRRPLALGKQATLYRTAGDMRHRSWLRGVWLDVAPAYVPVAAECRCGDEYVPAGWLAEQIAAGQKRRVLDAATRREISTRASTYPPPQAGTL
jgi:hypothetical protein